jgi:hypothetical protein
VSARTAPVRVRVVVVVPETLPVLVRTVVPFRHWYESVPPPTTVAATVKVAFVPDTTVVLTGCVPITGAAFTRRAALELVVVVVVAFSVRVMTTL